MRRDSGDFTGCSKGERENHYLKVLARSAVSLPAVVMLVTDSWQRDLRAGSWEAQLQTM